MNNDRDPSAEPADDPSVQARIRKALKGKSLVVKALVWWVSGSPIAAFAASKRGARGGATGNHGDVCNSGERLLSALLLPGTERV